MRFKIDMHVHTKHSGDNDAEPDLMVEAAIGRGLDGIVFTEHNFYGYSEHVEVLRVKYSGRLCILRGIEVSAFEGHCLVYGVDVDRLSLNGETIYKVIRVVHKMGGVVIPSHPYRRGSGIGDDLKTLADICAVEGFNGCNMHTMNVQAIEAARTLGVPYIGGSDAHFPAEVGNCHTEFECAVTEENLVELLRAGCYTGVDVRKVSRSGWPLL